MNCKSLPAISVPEGVHTIGEEAFFACESLINVTLPVTLSSVEKYAFFSCTSIKGVKFAGAADRFNSISFAYGNGDLTDAYGGA